MSCLFLYIVVLSKFLLIVKGSHFLGGTITWRVLNSSTTGTPVDVVITQTYSWTYLLVTCTNAMIAANQFVPTGPYNFGTKTLDCISNCINGSTGYIAPPVIPRCTDISAPIGTTVGQRLDTVSLQSGDDFSVAFQDSAWRSLATAASANWSISTHINLIPRSDNGLYDNAPVATMMSPINIIVNETTVITIPVGDPDGDTVHCRWANSSNGVDECGGVCPPNSLPPDTIIYPDCTILITGTNVGDWFAVTLMIEDFIDPTSTIPLSSVPVQFLVQVISPPSCNITPEIIGLPLEDSCLPIVVNQAYSTEIIAINYCGSSVSISDIATLSFAGVIKSPLAMSNSTVYYKNITWTPTTAQLGYQVMCTIAIDSQNFQSKQYCFKFFVSEETLCACPGYVCNSTTSMSTTIATTIATTTTTTTTTIQSNFFDWPLIGSLAGFVLLGTLILSCYLLWHFFYAYNFRKGNDRDDIFELYHIERCTDPRCRSNYGSHSPNILFVPLHKYFVYNILDDETNNVTTTQLSSKKVKNFVETPNLHTDRLLTTVDTDHLRQKSPNVKIPRSKDDVSNQKIKDEHHLAPEISENIPISEIKSIAKQRTHSMNDDKSQAPEKKSNEEFHTRRKRKKARNVIHVTNILSQISKTSLTNHNYPPDVNHTIPHDEIDENRKIHQTSKIDNNKMRVKYIPSTHQSTTNNELYHSLIDTIDLPTIKSSSKGLDSSAVHDKQIPIVYVEHTLMTKKKLKSMNKTTISDKPLFKKIKKKKKKKENESNEVQIKSSVTVERMLRKKDL